MIKVLIVDDQELFRESLKVVLSVSDNIRVTDAVSGVAQALKSAEQDRPDVVLMDMRMPGTDGVEGTRLFKKRWPEIKIIVLTTLIYFPHMIYNHLILIFLENFLYIQTDMH